MSNPNTMHPSMLNHPAKRPPMVMLYHPDKAPKGQSFHEGEAIGIHGKNGWVDSPAKFPGVSSKSQDVQDGSADADDMKAIIVAEKQKMIREMVQSVQASEAVSVPDFALWDKKELEQLVVECGFCDGLAKNKGITKLAEEVTTMLESYNEALEDVES